MTTNPIPSVPTYRKDLFSDEVLLDPHPHYRELRAMGPVVWLETLEMYALPRYAESREASTDAATFCSGLGVGLNDTVNHMARGTTLMCDGVQHDTFRRIIARPMTPGALRSWQPDVQALADGLVDKLVGQGPFDAVPELVQFLPVSWVPDLLGWPHDRRDRLVDWGASAFDLLGPMNERAMSAAPIFGEMFEYGAAVATDRRIEPGGIAQSIIDATDRGEITPEQCPGLMLDLLAPSIDTTVSGFGNAIWLFAEHPDQWEKVRADRSLIPNAFNEVLRYETPLSCFTRVTTREVEIGGVELPAGARVVVMYGSANRDELVWDRPDEFDVTREGAGAQMSFGFGAHVCAGMGLARLEGHAMLAALAERVERIELAGPPVRRLNNLIRSFEQLPVSLVPAG